MFIHSVAYVLAYQFITIILKLLYCDILLDLVLCLYTFMLSKFFIWYSIN